MMTSVRDSSMSHIFPKNPSKVVVHHLPTKAEFFTYRICEMLTVSAWMPKGYQTIHQNDEMTHDEFYHEFCEDCARNCYGFLEDYLDEDGAVDESLLPNHCFVYDEGYTGQKCPLGNEKEDSTVNFTISGMVFEISFTYMNEKYGRFEAKGDTAYLCAGYVSEDNEIYSTYRHLPSNVFGSDEFPERICWGYNDVPDNLRGIVTNYFSTPFNNDLVNLYSFERNSNLVNRYVRDNKFYYNSSDKFLCFGMYVDSLIMVDAEKDVTAFFTFLSAGFKPLEGAPHIMLIPAKETLIEKNGYHYKGYETTTDAVGKKWFISEEHLLIGQI